MRYSVSVWFGSDGRIDVSGDEITISIESPPERGKANRELVKKLAAHFGRGERQNPDNFGLDIAEKGSPNTVTIKKGEGVSIHIVSYIAGLAQKYS